MKPGVRAVFHAPWQAVALVAWTAAVAGVLAWWVWDLDWRGKFKISTVIAGTLVIGLMAGAKFIEALGGRSGPGPVSHGEDWRAP